MFTKLAYPGIYKWLVWTRLILCLSAAVTFGSRALHADSSKDAAQDQHMSYIDQQLAEMNTDRKEARNKRDLQIDELKSVNSELQSRMAHDEGLAAGAFAIVGGLSTLGLLRKRNEGDG